MVIGRSVSSKKMKFEVNDENERQLKGLSTEDMAKTASQYTQDTLSGV